MVIQVFSGLKQFIKKTITKRKKSNRSSTPQRDLTNSEWERLVAQKQRKTSVKTKPRTKKATTKKQVHKQPTATQKPQTTRRQKTTDAVILADAEIVGKYVLKKGRKTAREFAGDMGVTYKTMAKNLDDWGRSPAQKKIKRVTIPKSIAVNGKNYEKYCSYEGNRSAAQVAASDMQELGYKTQIMRVYRGSYPIYILYRYKSKRISH